MTYAAVRAQLNIPKIYHSNSQLIPKVALVIRRNIYRSNLLSEEIKV
jgi:hypothetical protein